METSTFVEVARTAKWWCADRLDGKTSEWMPMTLHDGSAVKPRRWFHMSECTREMFLKLWGPGIYRIHTGSERRRQWTSGPVEVDLPETQPPQPDAGAVSTEGNGAAPTPAASTAVPAQVAPGYVQPLVAIPFAPPPGCPPALTEFVYIEGLVQQRVSQFLQMVMAQSHLMLEGERNRSREAIESSREHYAALQTGQNQLTAAMFQVHQAQLAAVNARPAVPAELVAQIQALAQGQEKLALAITDLDAEDAAQLAELAEREPTKIDVVVHGIQQLLAIAGPVIAEWQKIRAGDGAATPKEQGT